MPGRSPVLLARPPAPGPAPRMVVSRWSARTPAGLCGPTARRLDSLHVVRRVRTPSAVALRTPAVSSSAMAACSVALLGTGVSISSKAALARSRRSARLPMGPGSHAPTTSTVRTLATSSAALHRTARRAASPRPTALGPTAGDGRCRGARPRRAPARRRSAFAPTAACESGIAVETDREGLVVRNEVAGAQLEERDAQSCERPVEC